MRYDVEKLLFYGTPGEMETFFTKAQKLGVIEFIDPKAKKLSMPKQLTTYLDAIRILNTHFTTKEQQVPNHKTALVLAQEINTLETEKVSLEEKKKHLQNEKAKLGALGQFSMDDVRFIQKETGIKLQFFHASHKIKADDLPLIYIGSEYDQYFYVAISSRKVQRKGLIPIEITHSLEEITQSIKGIDARLLEIERLFIAYTSYYQFIHKGMLEHLNYYHKNQAKSYITSQLDDQLFTIFAWIPKNKKDLLEDLLEDLPVACTPVNIDAKDTTPTYLENKKLSKIGEDLISLYDPPSAQDADPSLWVVLSFAVFFSIIISDAGYGLILFLLSLYFKRKYKQAKGALRRFGHLCLTLSIGTMLWGVLTSSYFGIDFPIQSSIQQFSFIQQLVEKKVSYHARNKDAVFQDWAKRFHMITHTTDPQEILEEAKVEHGGKINYQMQNQFQRDILLEISVIIGVLHVILSMSRYLRRNRASMGWILAVIGGYLYFPVVIKSTSIVNFLFGITPATCAFVGSWLLTVGVGTACLLALIQKRLGGLFEITESIQIFADILSYLRLYALALAGMVMGSTFNDLGRQAGPWFGPLVIILGHTINLGMAVMGGVIHGLRLNFIEWYHYSFIGGGKMFKPLKILK